MQSKIRSWRRAIVMRGVSGINGGNWSDVPSEKCGCDECPKVAAVKEQTTISYIEPEGIVIDEDGTRNIHNVPSWNKT